MMIRTTAVLLTLLFLSACSSNDDEQTTPTQGPVVYVFGDSLSDTGNLGRPATFSDDLPAPFYQNRISNGPVIVDYVAQAQGRTLEASDYLSLQEEGTNYAIAGAKAYEEDIAIDLATQVSSFRTKNDGEAPGDAIYLIFIGGNDVLGAVGAGADGLADLDKGAGEVAKAVQELTEMGARRFFVLTVPDIGKTPKLIADQTPGSAERRAQGTSLTISFNANVQNLLSAIPAPSQVAVIDVFALFNDVVARAVQFDYVNSTQACYITSELRFSDICSPGLLDGFVFFDEIHPSGKTHRLVGEQVAAQINAQLN